MRAATAHHESRSTSPATLRWGYGGDMATESLVPGFTNKRLFVVLGALALAVMLANLETSIIATALPTITGQFNAFESFAWVGTAYIVTSAISTPLLGKLSDLYGRRMIFQITMGLFLVGSILCGASQSIGQLIAARAFQGMGGGGMVGGGMGGGNFGGLIGGGGGGGGGVTNGKLKLCFKSAPP